jgi:hypothetical protein
MARYMSWMNDSPVKIGAKWDWSKTDISGWSGWGFMKG